MNTIEFNVKGNHLEITKDEISTQGSINYDNCHFTFDSEWTGFNKSAVFSVGSSDFFRIDLTDDSCVIPAGCMEKEGIISIGVFGINDADVIITTNSVAHYVNEGISDVGEWIEEDETLVKNAINEFKAYAKEYTDTLDKRFETLLDKVNQSGGLNKSNSITSSGDWFVPKDFNDISSVPAISKGSTYDDFLNYMLNPLVNDFPDYVSKQQIGMDASDKYSIYSYTFEPVNYEKTIVISTFIHGFDRIAYLSLCNFLDTLCRKSDTDRCLGYLKNNIKLVVVPVVNPYGVVNNCTANANKVNIGNNFPFKWDSCYASAKGTSAADQQETKNLIALMQAVSSDKLCAVIELHTSSSTIAGRTIFYPRGQKTCITALAELVNGFNSTVESTDLASTAILTSSINPTFSNYVADEYKVNACELVWTNSVYGGVNSNLNVTKYTQLIGNTVCVMAKNSTVNYVPPIGPLVKHVKWRKSSDSDVFNIPQSTTLNKMNISEFSVSLNCPSAVTVTGYVLISVTTQCTVKINPVLWQKNLTDNEYLDRVSDDSFLLELTLNTGVHVVPVSSVIYGLFCCYNDDNGSLYSEKLSFALTFSSSVASGASVTGFSITLNAEPSAIAHPVNVSKPMGNVADYTNSDIPTQELIYPIDTYSSLDMSYSD